LGWEASQEATPKEGLIMAEPKKMRAHGLYLCLFGWQKVLFADLRGQQEHDVDQVRLQA
jgi:hypothetical protein